MPGAYCRYCDHRCFVDRVLPDTGRRLHMATCPAGKTHDRTMSGFDADTAINPAAISDDPQAAATAPTSVGVRR